MHEEEDPSARDPEEDEQGSESDLQLSSWVLDLRSRFSDRAPMVLPEGVEGAEGLPRVVFLIALSVLEEQLCVVLSLEDDLGSGGAAEREVLEARLPAREALGDGEGGEDPAVDWFAPLDWNEPLHRFPDDLADSADPTDPEAADSEDDSEIDPVWGAATALVRDFYTDEVQLALRIGELDDQLHVGRRVMACVVALPRKVVLDLVEREAVLVLPLDRIREPDHVEVVSVEVNGDPELLHDLYFDERLVPGVSSTMLGLLLERLGLEPFDSVS